MHIDDDLQAGLLNARERVEQDAIDRLTLLAFEDNERRGIDRQAHRFETGFAQRL